MITAKELLAYGWNWYPSVSDGKILRMWQHAKLKEGGRTAFTLAQARRAQEHILGGNNAL